MEMILLGTAAAEGWPAPFCACVHCNAARSRGGANIRTRSGALIDDELKKGWKANSTYPSERCSDYEFIRRASLDIIGRIPSVGEIKNFMAQLEGKRRSWLINEMLLNVEPISSCRSRAILLLIAKTFLIWLMRYR